MSKSKAVAIPALGGEQSLNRYLSEIKKFPVLTAEQEYMLAKRYEEHEDPEAAAQLVAAWRWTLQRWAQQQRAHRAARVAMAARCWSL